MSDRLDYEKVNKTGRVSKRGQEIVDGKKLTDRQKNRLSEGIEKAHKKAAATVEKLREREAELEPRNPKQQVAYLDHLFRELSPSHKQSKQYGLFLKEKIAQLRASPACQEQEKSKACPKVHTAKKKDTRHA
ncbi:MAG: hypothetical protein P1U75_08980 [Antarcticimicrobium sp.]|uniref:hypothetical protein n=1 Tax=Antarcticimicrobium sp. TaxID=2824147 RepID=UPI002609DF69|nr:hypothetical protein [Antarcticimicrobium sp.]MDF1716786.1 hypothetical protein [Antarcticimicrobium sp.]